jgi:cytochrome b subunit of formate dehydrogenase
MKIHTQQGEQIKKISFMVLMVWMVYLIITGLIIGLGYWVYNIPVGTFTP